MRFAVAILLVGYCSATFADECSSVIALSRIKDAEISDQSEIEANANNFCSEYANSQSSSTSSSFGASYSFLAASFGSSGATASQVASKYCSATSHSAASANAYQRYRDMIAPGAFDAYKACVDSSSKNLRYSVNSGSMIEKQFTISAAFDPSPGAHDAQVVYVTGPGVRCVWNNTSNAKTSIAEQHAAALTCSRVDSSYDTYVTVQMLTGAVSPLTIRWPAYKSGVPASALSDLKNGLAALTAQIQRTQQLVQTGSLASGGGPPATAGNGERAVTFAVKFPLTYKTKPDVTVAINNADSPALTRFRIDASDISETGFTAKYVTWGNTIINNAGIQWVAVGYPAP
jgi:hypothetical protein